MGFSLNISVPAAAVFLQGLLSFFSPCVLPLLPVYFGFLSGRTISEESGRKKVLINTLFFVAGISFAFFLLGFGMTALGTFFRSSQMLFSRIGGCIVILLGLYQTGLFGNSGILSRELRLPFRMDRVSASPVTALILGFVFSFSWTPCVGPILSSVLILSASSGSRSLGFGLIGIYTLGFVLPFLASGLFTASLLRLFHKHRNVVQYTEKLGGVLLLFMGVLMVTGSMNRLIGNSAESPQSDQDLPYTEQTQYPNESEQSGETVPYTSTEHSAETDTPASDKPAATDFELLDQYGNMQRLSDYRGKVVFLNFWATWCPPCRAEMPAIQSLYEEFQNNGGDVVFLGVASPGLGNETSEDGIRAFLEENGYTYPVAMDASGSIFSAYSISAIPTTFMIDRNGNLFGYVPGSMSEEIMRSIIEQTLAAEQ